MILRLQRVEVVDEDTEEAIDDQTLEFSPEVFLENRPDASTAPELFERVNAAPRAITAQNAFLMQDMMRDVIRRGTGRRAMAIGSRFADRGFDD